jgi:hypothetical protein
MVGILPDRTALVRLVGAVLAEQHNQWAEGRPYLGLDVLARSRMAPISNPDTNTESEALHRPHSPPRVHQPGSRGVTSSSTTTWTRPLIP